MAWTLSQVQNGQERLIHAGGQKCSAGESNYPSYKGELCALVSAIKRLDHYLSLPPFVVRTDNSALRWLVSLKTGEAIVVRWGQILGQYNFCVEHVPGKDNVIADALSRNPDLYTEADDQEDVQRDEEAFCQLHSSTASLHQAGSNSEDVYTPVCDERGATQPPSPRCAERQSDGQGEKGKGERTYCS